MRSETEIKHKYRQLVLRNLARLFQKKLSKRPWNCVHHHYQPEVITTDNLVEVGQSGFCMYNSDHPESWEGRICETVADATGCPYFKAQQSKQEIYKEFMSSLGDPEVLQHGFRDLYILQWILGPTKLNWWDKLRIWVLRRGNYTREGQAISRVSEELPMGDLSDKLFPDQQ